VAGASGLAAFDAGFPDPFHLELQLELQIGGAIAQRKRIEIAQAG